MSSAWRTLVGMLALSAAFCAVAEPGVTPTTIVIGQSAAFSGPASELGTEMRAGAMAYFQAVNAAGGVNGRKIELRSLDDGYESDRAAANTKKLIDDGVFLLFGYVGTPTSNASKPIFTAARFRSSVLSPAPSRCAIRSTATSSTSARATTTRPISSSASLSARRSIASRCSTRTTTTARRGSRASSARCRSAT